MKNYDHKKIEQMWQEKWRKDSLYTISNKVDGKENFYLLVEFPYPSGNLHVGHWYAFAVPDILARAMRMQGRNVLYPIGFDAFGLPAENAAIKNNLNPREWTLANIAHMKDQIASMGTSFDWSREVSTMDPAYYKWTQWLFLQFFKNDLVYRKETAVNWCPKDKTVLANEQVVAGKCERCGTEVEQRQMLQWNIKITDYADRLIDDLEPLDWPEQIKQSQRNWIGRSEGAEIDFMLDFGDEKINARVGSDGKKAHITVFTTRSDTLYGASYLVLAPEHPWVALALAHKSVLSNNDEVAVYVDRTSKMSDLDRQANKEKTGVKLKGVVAINPATNEKIPLYIADYVLPHYGTGAIMAVPAHDDRDYAFAKKFGLPVSRVIEPIFKDSSTSPIKPDLPMIKKDAVCVIVRNSKDDTYLCIQWKGDVHMHGLVTGGIEEGEDIAEAAKREVLAETGYKNLQLVKDPDFAIHSLFYHRKKLQNRWARFRYILFELENEEKMPVEEKEAALHEVVWKNRKDLNNFFSVIEGEFILNFIDNPDFIFAGEGILCNSQEFNGMESQEANEKITQKFGSKKTTYKLRDWVVSRQRFWGVPIPIIHCPTCGVVEVPDADLPVILPDVEDYLPTGDGKSPLAKVRHWVEVPCPTCNSQAERETDTFDTFVDSSWYFQRYTDPKSSQTFASAESLAAWMPVDLYSGGAEHTTMHVLYSRFWQKAMYDLGLVKDAEPYTRRMNRSLIMGPDGLKMSKSKGNVIDPDEVVNLLGADTVRLYLAFIGPYNEVSSYPWNPNGVVGVRRFLERAIRISEMVIESDVIAINNILHKAIKKITEDIAALKFNTAISQMMILINSIEKEKSIGRAQYEVLLKLLAPFAPHITEEIWHELGNRSSIHLETWPQHDTTLMKDNTVTITIQINGKMRGDMQIGVDYDKAAVEASAREVAAKYLQGKTVSRVIMVPNRLVNFVVAD
jgi:leucyl-tRNA synthetase